MMEWDHTDSPHYTYYVTYPVKYLSDVIHAKESTLLTSFDTQISPRVLYPFSNKVTYYYYRKLNMVIC